MIERSSSSDGETIDYVLVYSKTSVSSDINKKNILTSFIKNVKSMGLQVHESDARTVEDLACYEIHAPQEILAKYADYFRIHLSKDNPHYHYRTKWKYKWMTTLATKPDPKDPIFQRAPDTFSGNQPTDFTNAERILIVHRILSSLEPGLKPLIQNKVILQAYPLHDSSFEWTDEGPVTDRQMPLQRATAQFDREVLWPQVGFYFAWIEFYTKMLVPAAIIGILCFIAGIILYHYDGQHIEQEVCNTDQMLCPVCPSEEWCTFIPLKHSCTMLKCAYVLENPITVVYSILMSFWGIVFWVLWQRKRAMLTLRWNMNDIPAQKHIRQEYIRAAHVPKVSSITGDLEYYIAPWQVIVFRAASYVMIIVMFFLYTLGVVIVMVYRLNINYYGIRTHNTRFKEMLSLFETISAAFITFMIMCILDTFKKGLCKKLTKLENPRTEHAYEVSLTTKLIILSFGNIFFPVVYLAFFKGHFYTHPGDASQWATVGLLKIDVCKISGCLVDLSFQLIIIMVLQNGNRLFAEVILPFVTIFKKKRKVTHIPTVRDGAQWEKDYFLVQNESDFLYVEYIQMALQYGFMTFFVVALPIAPFLAFVNNILEIRFDAMKFLKNYRRIVPSQVTGIKMWNTVLRVITVLGTISNPLLIAFSSNFIPRIIYRRKNKGLSGFINSTLSEFAVEDYPGYRKAGSNICLYHGKRFGPTHPKKYHLTSDYWHELAFKAICFILLENMCLLFSLFLGYVIPKIPRGVQRKLEYEQNTRTI